MKGPLSVGLIMKLNIYDHQSSVTQIKINLFMLMTLLFQNLCGEKSW